MFSALLLINNLCRDTEVCATILLLTKIIPLNLASTDDRLLLCGHHKMISFRLQYLCHIYFWSLVSSKQQLCLLHHLVVYLLIHFKYGLVNPYLLIVYNSLLCFIILVPKFPQVW
jgi:hypothetical protein